MNLFVVESPTQALNAIEARERFPGGRNELVVLETGLFDRNVFERVIDRRNWDRVEYLPFALLGRDRDFGKRPARNLRERAIEVGLVFYGTLLRERINRLARRAGPVERLFLGQYRDDTHLWFRHLARRCPHGELFLLDDGTDTVLVNDQREAEVTSDGPTRVPKPKGWKSRLRRALTKWDARGAENLTFFTSLDIDVNARDRVVRNDYRNLRSLAATGGDDTRVFFLGQTLVDDGYLPVEGFFRALGSVVDHYRGRPVTYVPHPRESARYVDEIARRTPFEVRRFDVPFEGEDTIRGNRPGTIAGFFSSALENCARIFDGDVAVEAIHIDPGTLLKQRELVARLYAHLDRTEGVQVVRVVAERSS